MAVLEKVTKLGLNVEKTEQYIEEKIGRVKEQENFRKRSVLFRDIRLFANTIQKAVETMQAAGIPAEMHKNPVRRLYRISNQNFYDEKRLI